MRPTQLATSPCSLKGELVWLQSAVQAVSYMQSGVKNVETHLIA